MSNWAWISCALNQYCISQVLGVPVDTVYEKLAKDPMMTKTFDLGNQEHFNDDFKKVDEKFTYLVPTDKAWEEIQQEMATAHKVCFQPFWPPQAFLDQVLFMGEFFYQSEKILKRHLRVSLKTSNLISFCPTQPPTPKSSYWKRVITHSTLSNRHNIRWNVLSTSPQHTYYKYFDVAVKMLSKMY